MVGKGALNSEPAVPREELVETIGDADTDVKLGEENNVLLLVTLVSAPVIEGVVRLPKEAVAMFEGVVKVGFTAPLSSPSKAEREEPPEALLAGVVARAPKPNDEPVVAELDVGNRLEAAEGFDSEDAIMDLLGTGPLETGMLGLDCTNETCGDGTVTL